MGLKVWATAGASWLALAGVATANDVGGAREPDIRSSNVALDADDQGGGEIVVTARRTLENLQDVPIPVSVLSGELLADSSTSSVLSIPV
jgi:iron complex outermembrane recepter protein